MILSKKWKNFHKEKPAPGDVIYTIGPICTEVLGRYINHKTWFIAFDGSIKGWYPKHWYPAPGEISDQYNKKEIENVSSRTGKSIRQYTKRTKKLDD